MSGTAPDWQAWIGRSERRHLRADETAIALLEDTLDRDPLPPDAPVPPLRHWLFAPPRIPTRALAADGHPPRGDLVPPWPLPRRMWAGSSVRWLAPLTVDAPIERRTTVESVTTKAGRSGTLGFVTLRHEWFAGAVRAIDETQTLVYRDAPSTASTAPAAPAAAPAGAPHPAKGGWERAIVPSEMLLFRYSAVTFNTHRIHYDRDYARQVEGYPDIVVHGPLMATLMLDAFRDANPNAKIRRFGFRGIQPAFAGQSLSIGGEPGDEGVDGCRAARLWVRGADGVVRVAGDVDFDFD